ncbi:acyltransferase family protein [Paraburkholderia dinghuensis]|uniref:Acyltransferase n=1 Tax=Paraburkholderia dinghuensis TaxID=2305225 RepID=A0A3N6MSC2_9BURK|nr:acyltransferase [Paraburkholderia dinghuensis]RQH04725.1 acyltransferase [Paraburkholderia dinghuensis]
MKNDNRFILLDGLRGVAAFIVLVFHLIQQHTLTALPYAGLAVDFFYVLSGFVVACAYERKILSGQMQTRDFVETRIKRLYPLIFLSTSIGISIALLAVIFKDSITLLQLLKITALGLLVLPSFVLPQWQTAYPLNMASWSLTFEAFVNLVYISIVRQLTNKALILIVSLSWFALLFLAIHANGISGGNNQNAWPLGFLRVMFPFFAGVALYRFKRHQKESTATGIALLLSLAAILLANLPNYRVCSLIYVSIVFPAIVYIGSGIIVTYKINAISYWLGAISYPVYIMQGPILRIGEEVIKHIHSNAMTWLVSISEFCVVVLVSWAALKFFDEPVQRIMRGQKRLRQGDFVRNA